MLSTPTTTLTLDEFLQQPHIEDSPAWEFVAGLATQKPMPKAHHSLLQSKLCAVINQVTEEANIAYAFPELRCTFGGRSIVPDIAVLMWNRIPFDSNGEVERDAIPHPPDWTIEILSPGQRSTQVIENVMHCLAWGGRLGWMLEPEDRSIFGFRPQQELQIYRSDDLLPVLPEIDLQLTVAQIYRWLSFRR